MATTQNQLFLDSSTVMTVLEGEEDEAAGRVGKGLARAACRGNKVVYVFKNNVKS